MIENVSIHFRYRSDSGVLLVRGSQLLHGTEGEGGKCQLTNNERPGPARGTPFTPRTSSGRLAKLDLD